MIWLLLVVVGVGALLGLEYRRSRYRVVAKAMASAGFVLVAIASGSTDTVYGWAVLVALGLSLIGDVLLTSPARSAFLAGLGAFLLAHIGFTVAFVIRGLDGPTVAAATIGVAVLVSAIWNRLRTHVGSMRVPVAIYVVVISAMVIGAIGTAPIVRDPRIVIGAIGFFVSDLAVARDRFVVPGFVNRLWGLPLYYAAQVFLAASTAMV